MHRPQPERAGRFRLTSKGAISRSLRCLPQPVPLQGRVRAATPRATIAPARRGPAAPGPLHHSEQQVRRRPIAERQGSRREAEDRTRGRRGRWRFPAADGRRQRRRRRWQQRRSTPHARVAARRLEASEPASALEQPEAPALERRQTSAQPCSGRARTRGRRCPQLRASRPRWSNGWLCGLALPWATDSTTAVARQGRRQGDGVRLPGASDMQPNGTGG